jgi:hypothetical protein
VSWDETIYRITRIPGDFGSPHLLQVLDSLFELGDDEIRIHSLAHDATDETEPLLKVATVSFRTRPTHLQSILKNKDEWPFDIALGSAGLTKRHRIYLDRHFNGFTPLSSVEDSEEHTIECALLLIS